MPHVSNHKLDERTLIKLHQQLTSFLVRHPNKQVRASALNELLTDTEKVMLAKRLACIVFLAKELPFTLIQDALQMSPSTIERYRNEVNGGQYRAIISVFQTKESDSRFWEVTRDIFRIFHPEMMGKRRWEIVNKYLSRT